MKNNNLVWIIAIIVLIMAAKQGGIFSGSLIPGPTGFTQYQENANSHVFSGAYPGTIFNNGPYVDVTYNKPINSTAAKWKVKHGTGTEEIDVPSSCFDTYPDSIVLRMESSENGNGKDWLRLSCWNGDWNQIFYEEKSRVTGYPTNLGSCNGYCPNCGNEIFDGDWNAGTRWSPGHSNANGHSIWCDGGTFTSSIYEEAITWGFPTFIECTPDWQCSSFTDCQSDGTKTRNCVDVNSCGDDTGKPIESESCTYVAPTCDVSHTQGDLISTLCSENNVVEQQWNCNDINWEQKEVVKQICSGNEKCIDSKCELQLGGGGGTRGKVVTTNETTAPVTETKNNNILILTAIIGGSAIWWLLTRKKK